MTDNAHMVTTRMAIRYLDAAKVLWKSSPSVGAFWEPLNHLISMSTELTLKAFLERAGMSEKELKSHSVRHSLNSLLLLAVKHGLRTTRDNANAVVEMDQAHSSHVHRYAPRPPKGQSITVYSAHPAVAFSTLQNLLYQCAEDTQRIQTLSNFPKDWPPPSLPLHPINSDELEDLIEEKMRLRAWAESEWDRRS